MSAGRQVVIHSGGVFRRESGDYPGTRAEVLPRESGDSSPRERRLFPARAETLPRESGGSSDMRAETLPARKRRLSRYESADRERRAEGADQAGAPGGNADQA
ncbi:hypothetical protein Aut01nite_76550 [Actinoplanes utahensis]|nr:hypothetical protein Aut01nite_76550 [Actinoplanes utahensis]